MDKERNDDPILAKEIGLTCEKGECEEGTDENGKTIFCKYKPTIKQIKDTEFDNEICHYYKQKFEALLSKYSIWNYSAYFQLMKFNKPHYGEYLDKKLVIFDEAHSIEEQIIQFIGIDISKKQLEECHIDLKRYDVSKTEQIIHLLDSMRVFYGTEIGRMDRKEIPYDFKKYSIYDNNFKKFADIIKEIQNSPDNFVVSQLKDDFLQPTALSIKPLDISNYVKDFIEAEFQIFMSATIDKMSFSETMGLNPSEIAFIDTPKSPFQLEHRKVEFLDIGVLGKNAPPERELEAIKKIDELLTIHKNERGLILTQSNSRCRDILKNLSPHNKKRIRICHANNLNGKTQDEIISDHKQDQTSVLLSSSLWEGVDLKDDASRFQIIAKVPYQNLGDLRVKKKMKLYPLWFDSQALMTMLQGFGRSIRSEDDWAKTYVIDSGIHRLISSTHKIIPKAYHDVLGLS